MSKNTGGPAFPTHFTVVFERPEGYEDVHVELCAEDFINPPSNVRYEWFDGNLAQQRDMLLEALNLVMPMAKGYACAHKVGSNAEYIRHAEDAIAAVEGEK